MYSRVDSLRLVAVLSILSPWQLGLSEPLLRLHPFVSQLLRRRGQRFLTFQPFVNSKPAGACARSICPLSRPVNRRSRSITNIESAKSHRRRRVSILCCISVSGQSSLPDRASTYPIPLVYRVSRALAIVLHPLDSGKTSSRNTEHLVVVSKKLNVTSLDRRTSAYPDDDGVRQQGLERDGHVGGCAAKAVLYGSRCSVV